MQFSDSGYIIKVRNHGEKSLIVTLVCPQKGKVVGYVKGGLSKRGLGIYQIGNCISFNAYARIEENMLSLRGVELAHSYAADFLLDNDKLEALASLCRLVDECVAENDVLADFYHLIDDFFVHIKDSNWLVYYTFFEYYLLEFLGIGLDTDKCAVTGRTDDLRYISPKSGRAVCAEAGAPYKDRLFAYPQYIVDKNYRPQTREMADLLALTGNFLQKNFFGQHNLKLPEQRNNLLSIVKTYKL